MALSDDTRKQLFDTLKKHLQQCTPPMVVATDEDQQAYELIGNKAVPYGYDKKTIPGMFFASLVQRKDSVAFHFFPCYMNPAMKEAAPTLYKRLKGKTCFHFKKEAEVNESELQELLKQGMEAWTRAGYMK